MSSDFTFLAFRSFDYHRAPNGTVSIRRSILPRGPLGVAIAGLILIVALTSALLIYSEIAPTNPDAAVAMAMFWGGLILVVGVTGVLYSRLRRPPTVVFDRDHRVVRIAAQRIPFAELGPISTFGRQDQESRDSLTAQAVHGPKLVTRFEVYFRLDHEQILLGEFRTEGEADALATELRHLVAPLS